MAYNCHFSTVSPLFGYVTPTKGFVYALVVMFAFNVEAQKANAEQVLASASKAQNIIDKAPSLLAELNPMYKEKQETEQRFGKIEGSIGEMKELMKKQQEMMENFIKKFES